ncbi:MAG: antibiotic biosynthesis monooxygenase [Mesorhizobium sp.]|nr:antibiotic biosynthesis monooxygenase [Mesorhizobium sp.]
MKVFVTTLRAKPNKIDELRAICVQLATEVRANEAGCAQYTICASDDPDTVVFVERFSDDAAIEAHRKADYFRTLGRKMGEFMDGAPVIQRFTQISQE